MSEVTYRYEQSYKFMKKGVKHSIKEQVIDGPLGLSVMFLEKTGDDFYKMYAKETEKNKFDLIETKGDKEETTSIDEKTLLKLLKDRKLEGIITFITKERGTYKGKKVSKKAIKIKGYENAGGAKKKVSKKASKKVSKKASKKASKK